MTVTFLNFYDDNSIDNFIIVGGRVSTIVVTCLSIYSIHQKASLSQLSLGQNATVRGGTTLHIIFWRYSGGFCDGSAPPPVWSGHTSSCGHGIFCRAIMAYFAVRSRGYFADHHGVFELYCNTIALPVSYVKMSWPPIFFQSTECEGSSGRALF